MAAMIFEEEFWRYRFGTKWLLTCLFADLALFSSQEKVNFANDGSHKCKNTNPYSLIPNPSTGDGP